MPRIEVVVVSSGRIACKDRREYTSVVKNAIPSYAREIARYPVSAGTLEARIQIWYESKGISG